MHLSDKRAVRHSGQSAGPDPLPLRRIDRRTAADEVRSQLIGLIESGQLKVNDRLPPETELSRRFGVSRSIVREALGRLQALGLTESRAGSGTFVSSSVTKMLTSVGQHSAADLNEIRRCLEVPAARLAAVRRKNSDLEELALSLERHEQATTPEQTLRSDNAFHCAIARATGNVLFLRLVEDLQEILEEQSLVESTLRPRGPSAAREHRRVLEAIKAADGDAAAALMDEHLDAVERAIRKLERAVKAPTTRRRQGKANGDRSKRRPAEGHG